MSNKRTSSEYKIFAIIMVIVFVPIVILYIVYGLWKISGAFLETNSNVSVYDEEKSKARIEDIKTLSNAIANYQVNNNFRVPEDIPKFRARYLNFSFNDPDGVPYSIVFERLKEGETKNLSQESYTMYIVANAKCTDDDKDEVEAYYVPYEKTSVVMYSQGRVKYCLAN